MSNSQDRFSFIRLLTFGGIAFLLLGLYLSSSAQAEMIYAVRVNAIDGAGDNSYYTNYQFSYSSGQWCTQANNTPYNGTTPVMLCDLGAIQTINSIKLDKYGAAGNNVKAMTLDFYDSPALSGTPVYSQTFTDIDINGDTLTLTTPTNARFVKFTMTENHGGDRYGVGNITFDVSSVVTPTSGTVSVNTYSGMSVDNLFDKDASTRWCSAKGAASQKNYFDFYDDPVFTFQLGDTKTLTGITVQGYNVIGNSIKDFELEFLDSAGNKISVDASKYKFTMSDSTNLVQNYFSFPEVEGVKQVKMTVTSNFTYSLASSGGDRIGLSEVYFSTIETQSPTTPEKYDSPMHEYNIIRPESAAFVTEAAARGSDASLNYLFDGTAGTVECGDKAWYTKKAGDDADGLNRGYSSVIDFTMPSESMYDSFSVWGYGSQGNQMTDFILELFDSSGKLVYADEFKTAKSLGASNFATFSFGDNYLFSTARMTILDNAYRWYGDSGGDRVGFAEIAFYQQPYYFVNTADIDANSWTINGTDKQGVLFTQGDKTATFAKPITLNADGVIDVAEGKTLQFSGGISGNNELKKIGEGTLKIDTTEGPVDIKRLLVSTGRLDMKSYYKGSLEIGEKIEDGKYTTATFSPGNSVGTLEITGSFTLNPGSTLLLEQDAGGMDQLTAESFVFEDGSFIELSMDAIAPGATYDIIVLSDGTFTGDQLTESYWTDLFKGGLPDYMILSLFGDSAVRLYVDPNAVPEPSTWALLALGVVVLFLRKRVRN